MYWLKIIYYGLLTLCLTALFLNYKRVGRHILLFIPVIILAIQTQVNGDILKAEGLGEKRFFVFHIYIPLEYLLLSYYYYLLLRGKWVSYFFILSNIGMVAFSAVYYSLNKASFYHPDFAQFVLGSVFVTFLGIIFFSQFFEKDERVDLISYPDFWINVGNLLFYAGCLFVMGLHYSLQKRNSELADRLLQINYYLNIILYFLYIVAFTCSKATKRYQ